MADRIKVKDRLRAANFPGMEQFGNLLLDLYRFSRELPLGDFQRRALERLRELIPFDSAWWGIVGADRELHNSYTFGLPDHFADVWESVKYDDDVAGVVLINPGVCVRYLRPRKMSPGLRQLLTQFNIEQVLCTSWLNPAVHLQTFLSLYRSTSKPIYSEDERVFTQQTMPHLWATWTTNWITQVEHIRAHSVVSRMALGIADRCGTLHTAEPALIEFIQLEWPRWRGPSLPSMVEQSFHTGLRIDGERVSLRALPVCGLYLIEARARSPLDRLTSREMTIAEGFGRGRSYKELAATLGVSPATVRAHLRAIYAKLDVSDKAELATILTPAQEAVLSKVNSPSTAI